MADIPDLLLIRLDTLSLDIEKVATAVEAAERRVELLRSARDVLDPHKRSLRAVAGTLTTLNDAMVDDAQAIMTTLNEHTDGLADSIQRAQPLLRNALAAVETSLGYLGRLLASAVNFESEPLRVSLRRRCDNLQAQVHDIRSSVEATAAEDRINKRQEQWHLYRATLESTAKPLFSEYVDFLGGLTLRDTGLDDQVCEMTDALLGRYSVLMRKKMPLPAHQAALGNALDSMVLLGFPEWSVWGIPLVAHEVGLAYANDRNIEDLTGLMNEFEPYVLQDMKSGTDHISDKWPNSSPLPSSTVLPTLEVSSPSMTFIHILVADVFATYTLGLSYACAALLLRLNPRHDEPRRLDKPRDIDRARVIKMTLSASGESIGVGGSFSEAVERLDRIWNDAAVHHAGPQDADEAANQVRGPAAHVDWLDDFTDAAVKHFGAMGKFVPPYNYDRWKSSELWLRALDDDKEPGPGVTPLSDVVPDLLTAAWRLRLFAQTEPTLVARTVKKMWDERAMRGG